MKITTIYSFPTEIWVNIFQKLTTHDKSAARRVCSLFYEIILEYFPLFKIIRELTLIKSIIGNEDYEQKKFYLKKEEYHLKFKKALEFDLKICSTEKQEIIKKLYNKHAIACMTYKYIFRGIFNGKENFLKLPVHHLSDSINFKEDEYIDCIKPEELKYPIMRGKDNLNRIYFTVRGMHSYKYLLWEQRHLFCTTFHIIGMGAWVYIQKQSAEFINKQFVCREEGIVEPAYSRIVKLLQKETIIPK